MQAKTYRNIIIVTSACWLVLASTVLHADNSKLAVHSGTGFFVSPQYVITNEHVLHQGCKQIIIQDRGKDWATAEIVAEDEVHDLALIHTPVWLRDNATLRTDFEDMHVGDKLVAVGYPLETLTQGKDYEVATAKMINPKESLGKDWMIQFSHAIKLGYSGGPLLDANGKVVGVVKDIAKMYETYTVNGKTSDQYFIGEVDEAINMTTLEEFLVAHNVSFKVGKNTDQRVGGLDFTINVQCVDEVQLD